MAKNDGGPAFPCEVDTSSLRPAQGMSLRDWFAGRMLPVLAATKLDSGHYMSPDAAANTAYEYADAMLKARSTDQ